MISVQSCCTLPCHTVLWLELLFSNKLLLSLSLLPLLSPLLTVSVPSLAVSGPHAGKILHTYVCSSSGRVLPFCVPLGGSFAIERYSGQLLRGRDDAVPAGVPALLSPFSPTPPRLKHLPAGGAAQLSGVKLFSCLLQVAGGRFEYDGQPVFLSGTNTAWVNYGYDFGDNGWADHGSV